MWIILSVVFIRIGEVRLSGGKLSDVCKCSSNSISTYDPNAVNTDRILDEDEDVKKERQTVDAMWNNPSEVGNAVIAAVIVDTLHTENFTW